MAPCAAGPLFRRTRAVGVGAVLAGAALLIGPAPARAQYIEQYFQPGVPGYGEEGGVTVLSRQRPLYAEQGVQLGDFNIRADLDEAFGYNSNVNGIANSPGSWFLSTAPSISAVSNWERNALGASLTANNYAYLGTPEQNHTDWTATLGGAYTIDRGNLTVGYSHLALHQLSTEIGALPSSNPIPYTVDDFRSDYTFDLGRISLVPNIDYEIYGFSPALINGQTVSQTYRNRDVLAGGVTTRYELSPQRNLLLVLQGIDTHYTNQPAGQINNNSTSFVLLTGIDYQANGVWRYRLLAGFELREFAAEQFGTQVAPIAEGSVIWTPTGLTTLTGTLTRVIEDPATADTGSYIYTTAQLVVDHELRRNILLEGRAQYQLAQYLNNGTQSGFTVGGGVTWLISPRFRLSANYSFTQQNGPSTVVTSVPGGPVTELGGNFNQNVVVVALHVGL